MITPKWDNRFRPPKKLSEWLQEFDEANIKENVQHQGEARVGEHSFGDSTLNTGCSSPRISIAHHGFSSDLSLPHNMRKFVMFLRVSLSSVSAFFPPSMVPQGVACHPLGPLTRVLCQSMTGEGRCGPGEGRFPWGTAVVLGKGGPPGEGRSSWGRAVLLKKGGLGEGRSSGQNQHPRNDLPPFHVHKKGVQRGEGVEPNPLWFSGGSKPTPFGLKGGFKPNPFGLKWSLNQTPFGNPLWFKPLSNPFEEPLPRGVHQCRMAKKKRQKCCTNGILFAGI